MEDITYLYGEALLIVLIVELFFLFFFVGTIIVRHLIAKNRSSSTNQLKVDISRALVSCINDHTSFHLTKGEFSFAELSTFLTIMEQFDQRFKGNEWEELKEEIVDKYFLEKARSFVKKRSWLKRNFAARVFALTPLKKDKESIITLIDDPVFLVRCAAARAAVKMELKEGIIKVLYHMSVEEGYPYAYYRDIILESSQEVFQLIEDIALDRSNKNLHIACLDILRYACFHLEKLHLDLEYHSEERDTRLAIVQVCAHNPQPISLDILLEAMDDKDSDIRAEASVGMEYFTTSKVFKKLETALNDEELRVRLCAALTLNVMGAEGERILRDQKIEKNEEAYEAAQYVLALD